MFQHSFENDLSATEGTASRDNTQAWRNRHASTDHPSRPGTLSAHGCPPNTALLPRLFAITLLAIFSFTSFAAELTLKKSDAKPPSEVSAEIAGVLDTGSLQLLDGDAPVFEFWFAKSVECGSKPASTDKALNAVKETALIGVIKVHKEMRDFRDDVLPAGIYTMRYGLQPEDGDHLGTAPYRWFVVLIPVTLDKSPGLMTDHKAMTDASKEEAPAEHPYNLSLWPVSSPDGEFPATAEPDDEHKILKLKLNGAASSETFDLVFGLVYEGVGEI